MPDSALIADLKERRDFAIMMAAQCQEAGDMDAVIAFQSQAIGIGNDMLRALGGHAMADAMDALNDALDDIQATLRPR